MSFLVERDLSNVPNIKEYFKGKSIFITGGSGFMGKVLIEKLLYSCSDLDKIYLLIRTKKNASPQERFATLYETPVFNRLRTEKPGLFESKVIFISGDIGAPDLDLSDEDRILLINKVNIIFHVAASVRFDDTLEYAAKLNLRGTKLMIELAQEMPNLESFVHVSTTFSNTNRETIEEIMYPPHADWRATLDVCENIDEQNLHIFTSKYLGKVNNTYIFTKQLAEHVVYEHKGKLPVVIIRPSVVVSSWKEPFVGWNENFNGPVGLLVGSAKGVVRIIYGKPDAKIDYIPVDSAVRHFITVAWIRGTKKLEPTDDVAIYNCCTGNLKCITLTKLKELGNKNIFNMPFDNNIFGISDTITSNKSYHYLGVIFQQLLPAIIIDTVLKLLGHKPMLVKIQRRVYNALLSLSNFITQKWTFVNNNFIKLGTYLKECDVNEFNFDVENIEEEEFFKNGLMGARKYILKEKDEDLPKAKAHLIRMTFIQRTSTFLLYAALAWYTWNSSFVQGYVETFLSL